MPRRFHLVALVGFTTAVGTVVAQAPPPPRALPASITGQPPGAAVTPVGGNTVATPVPMDRFLKERGAFPPETEQAVASLRLGADWLYRMNQPGGRFLPGLNTAVRQQLESDTDFRQALAALALCEAAKFTGDERYAARASGAVLALLATTRPDAADPACRVPTAANDRCNRVGYASVTALAIYHLPNADAKLLADADALMAFVRKQVRGNGAIAHNEPPTDEPHKADAEGAAIYPGYALQAMSLALRTRPDAQTRELFPKAMAYQARRLKSNPGPTLVATTLPALVDYALLSGKDPGVVGAALEAADWLLTCQVTRPEPRRAAWAGGFTTAPGAATEPTADSAVCALALCHAARLTRQIPDAARFAKYRGAAVEGLAFARNLQFTDESADHFEKSFRARYVVGGGRASPSDGTLRIDATAHAVLAHLAYLQCGTEQRPQ